MGVHLCNNCGSGASISWITRDPADDIKALLDADPVPDFKPSPIIKIDVLQLLNLIKNLLKRWI